MVLEIWRFFFTSAQLLCIVLHLTCILCAIATQNESNFVPDNMASSWAIRIPFKDGINDESLRNMAMKIAQETGLSFHGQIGGLRGHFLLVHDTFYGRDSSHIGSDVLHKITEQLQKHPEVEWSIREKIIRRYKRSLRFKDQYFPSQWHLNNLQYLGHDINVTTVWERNITGHGVVVAIVDDGVEWTNPDIFENYSSEGSWDLNSNDPDPTPRADDVGLNHHGTRCAGEIAAVANTFCAVGVAYGAKVSGVRILDGPMTDSLEAMAFNMKDQINDIYSCSWGPDDNGKTVDGPHQLAQAALAHGVRDGRGGLGSIYVVASGNGGNYKDNCNFDGYANSIFTVTIGAVDESGKMPYYAENCASMLAVTYSSGQTPLRNIVTTDWRMGSGTGCTNRHTGTSAAAPLAAGMLALALQTRWCLSWRDIQHLIVYSSVQHDVDPLDYTTNGAGFHHSHKYGFGLMDSWRLVNLAKVWTSVPWMVSWSTPVVQVNKYIPRSSSQLIETYYVQQRDLVEFSSLEHVTLTVNIDHKYRGSVLISVISPAGTESKLATERQQDSSAEGFIDWTFSTVRCWGEQPYGAWQVVIINSGLDDNSQGYVRNWRLTLYGSSMTPVEIKQRKSLARDAFSGRYLASNETASCMKISTLKDYSIFSDRLLTILLLVSGFCVLLAVYYMLDVICGKEEERENVRAEIRSPSSSPHDVLTMSPCFDHSGDNSPNSSLELSTRLKAEDTARLSHLLERGESFREQSSRRPTPILIDELSQNSANNSSSPNEVQAEGARDFEKRLQYAMKQSLILQGKQLKDIEILQEQLGHEASGVSNRIVMPNKKNVFEKIRKPLKGILKKSVARQAKLP
ncbi:proprotein convertase subtilisin/kexin type 7-like [Dendronephthya gigantea]|uniref:proprotein convertase subtilisin/kexin type 7-like n=1 Tax=Dendronephthya gigantea TaxID=151771 RepID=UPI00106C7A08|nr:proprotein convertase subtilisin/kexin type 7-like [Dendronephthya gigantea]XP_028402649.1 proprotein convertase subtilisin/kexin type 7-like [Dendronephthya gigantea]XP_028402650.1 proprotein convertase subtilisin/kexin type 7-like [Dendronephthya gigantea]XP_028402651.1 proprotein convertase subtilisin/kexin type 7-like [Dendronephthya gigantea]XP_028402652.1 proprotein convertase subtilisin/kexin type 7-like [Dendronephthya gigantea]